MTKAVTKKVTGAVAIPSDFQDWDSQETLDQRDITIPKIMLAQSNSPQTTDPDIDVSAGDLVINSTNRVVATKDESVTAMPLFCVKKWRTESKPAGSSEMFEWLSTEVVNPGNANAVYSWEEEGVEYRRVMVHEWIFLLADDIAGDLKARAQIAAGEMPDLDDALLPTVVAFKRTSIPASKEIFKFQAKAQSFKVPLFMQTFELGKKFVKEDKFSYFVMTVTKGRKSTEEEMKVCHEWYNLLKKDGFEVAEFEDIEETPKAVKTEAVKTHAQPVSRGHQADGFGQIDDSDLPF